MWSWGKKQFPLCKKKKSPSLTRASRRLSLSTTSVRIHLHIQQVVLLLDVALASVSIWTSPEGE